MGALGIRTNISSIKAQRQLNESTARLSNNYQRLSSGLRINRASDDAAGLAISQSLKLDSRVYGQAIRNANDGISALNIAEGGVTQLSGILVRLKELASSSANGSLGLSQRRSLDEEAFALTNEFNRIIESTKFNKRTLLDGSLSDLAIQLGYGSSESLLMSLGAGLKRDIGSGTFTNGATLSAAVFTAARAVVADINGDGINDYVAAGSTGVRLFIGNGDGSFGAAISVQTGINAESVAVGDLNGDGRLDIVASEGPRVTVSLNTGDSTFGAQTSYAAGTGANVNVKLADFDGDGRLDIVTGNNTGSARVFTNAGDGTFDTGTLYSMFGSGSLTGVDVGDLNGDGFDDIVATNSSLGSISIMLGNGSGGFGAVTTYSDASGANSIQLADFNHDGILDILSTGTSLVGASEVGVRLGVGDGTFGTEDIVGGGELSLISSATAADFNNDGIMDIGYLHTSDADFIFHYGNGDGTFGEGTVQTVVTGAQYATIGDLNNDGVVDLAVSENFGGTTRTYMADTEEVTNMERLNLTTSQGARLSLDTIEEYFQRVTNELGRMGSTQSRLRSALATLGNIRLNYEQANSRIIDVDTASEAAQLVANQIRQQVGTAVMAQANLLPQLVLGLLKDLSE